MIDKTLNGEVSLSDKSYIHRERYSLRVHAVAFWLSWT